MLYPSHLRPLGRLAAAALLVGLLLLLVAPPASADGVAVHAPASFESVNFPGHFIRHRNYLADLTTLGTDLDRTDATFIPRPALSGTPGAVSLESTNYPGHFLRHQYSRVKLHANDNGDLFKKDASFVVRPALSGTPGAVSFESVNYPGQFIRHANYQFVIAPNDGGDLFKKDASFKPGPDLRRGRDIRINDALLRVATAETFGKAQIRLDRDRSFVRIPGIFNADFALPAVLVPNALKDAHYYIQDVNSRSVTTSFKRGGVESCIDFETDGTELVGYVKTFWDDMYDGGAPDANAEPFTVCVWMPVAFDAAQQSIRVQGFSLDVRVHADWRYNGIGGAIQLINASLLPDINAGIKRGFEGLLLNETVQARLVNEFGQGVRRLVGTARVTGMSFDGDTLILRVQD